jgi:hypothetical protein
MDVTHDENMERTNDFKNLRPYTRYPDRCFLFETLLALKHLLKVVF